MRSSFHGLEVAKRGLYAQQTAISTTGHNIANANNKGYTRQRVDLTASIPLETPGMTNSKQAGQLGTGVTVDSITRLRETFLDEQFRDEQSIIGDWEVKKDTLEKIELILNEPTADSLSTVIDDFYNAWQDLSTDPTNQTARTVVRERANAMLDAVKHIDSQLTELQDDLTNKLNAKVTDTNSKLEQIAHFNGEIARIEGLGHNANDLRDKRDLLLDDLSKATSITFKEDTDGMVNVTSANGDKLVEGRNYLEIGTDVALTDLSGGELQGILDSRDTITEKYKDQVSHMIEGLINGKVSVEVPEGSNLAVDVNYTDDFGVTHTLTAGTPVPNGGIEIEVNGINGVHQLGWTNESGNAKQGEPFFTLDNVTGTFNIQDLQLNPVIANDVNAIATSLKTEGGQNLVGNADLSVIMGQLKNAKFDFSGGALTPSSKGSFSETLRSIVGALGVETQEAQRQVANQSVILHNIENNRLSVSGVSLDEEMSNLIKFQHAYNASARMLTTQDQLLDTIINRMGVVGR